MKKGILLTGLALCAVSANAQCFKEGYVEWGYGGPGFPDAVSTWESNHQVNADDNFFISRVKPKARFRNEATQVNPDFTPENDKNLIAWVPVNNPTVNGIPDGVFDSECFSMWSYVTHWGDWTCPQGRIPASFIDVAHKNGVGVSGVASIPNASLEGDWRTCIFNLGNNTDPKVAADFLRYYGNDGIGYNSEFYSNAGTMAPLRTFHENLVKNSSDNPLFANFWYDGTGDDGFVHFDEGLYYHNEETFGDSEHVRTHLFFNYNWNREGILDNSVDYAVNDLGRSPLDIYAGVNMQGGEPRWNSWPHLAKYPISIGLWGAHSMNMWWESRYEQGSAPEVQQRSYMLRTERYFTGGTRNPVNCPKITSTMNYNVENYDFHGMSSMMSARSSLKWDLGTEPFISYFNLGNGKFFNWMGERKNNNEWYNVGVQDYLPTWRWWFTTNLIGKTADQVPTTGLDAEFVWDEAYVGGSSLRIHGTTPEEYLHLFKTEYNLQAGDVITVRYMLKKGAGNVNLVLTAKGDEANAINENGMSILAGTDVIEDNEAWIEKKFTVGSELAGKDLALIALHFKGAENLDMRLGEFSIVRNEAVAPSKPEITSSSLLSFNHTGIDGKLIFNMPNTKAAGEPCYNIDVNTSLFKLYAQQEGTAEPIMMGITTSWAALYYSIPVDFALASNKVRLGVSAVSLDMKKESDIAWTEYIAPQEYLYNDEVALSKTTVKPNEAFSVSYVDSQHEPGTWRILSEEGTEIFRGEGHTVEVASGLEKVGNYTLEVTGPTYNEDKTAREVTTRTLPSYIQISGEEVGALPQIYTLKANDQEADIKVNAKDEIQLTYTGRPADGKLSRGLNLMEKGFGFLATQAGLTSGNNAWTCSFWVNFKTLPTGSVQFFDVRDQGTKWPQNNWGTYWATYEPSSKNLGFTINGAYGEHTNIWDVQFTPGIWTHIAITMEKTGSGVREHFFVNGKAAKAIEYFNNKGTHYPGYNPEYADCTGNWWEDNMVLIGAGRFGCTAMNAIIDDVKFFNTELQEADIAKLMNSAESGEDVHFSFDKNADEKNAFANETGKKDVHGGFLTQKSGEGEGVGAFAFATPGFDAGSPFTSGDNFVVTTTPNWKAKLGKLSNETGTSTEGSANVVYSKQGVYDVVLTLTNSYGSDSKTLKAITVGEATGIENAEVLETEVSVENGMAIVSIAQDGNYVINVYNTAGQRVASEAQAMVAGQTAQIALHQAGVYVLSVQKDGKTVANVKLLNK